MEFQQTDVPGQVEDLDPDQNSAVQLERQTQLAYAQADDTIVTVVEALEQYEAALEHLIHSGTATHATAQLVEQGVALQIARLGVSQQAKLGLESNEQDPVWRHRMALEGVRSLLERLADVTKTTMQEMKGSIADAFALHRSRIDKYRRVFEELAQQYQTGKKNWTPKPNEIEFLDFTDFFGSGRTFFNRLPKDLELNRYIFTSNTRDLLGLLKKVGGVLKAGSAKDLPSLQKLAKDLARLENPGGLFESRYLRQVWFGPQTYEEEVGTARGTLVLAGVPLDGLAKVSTKRWVVPKAGSWKLDSHDGDLRYTNDQVGVVIQTAGEYLKNLDAYLGTWSTFDHLLTDTFDALYKLAQQVVDQKLKGNDARAADRTLSQIEHYVMNIHDCVCWPSLQEADRAIKILRRSSQLVERMIKRAS